MTWARLDDGWHDHRKTIAAGLEGAGLFAMCLTWASKGYDKSPTPGVVPDAVIARFAGPKAKKLTKLLHQVGYFDDRVEAGWPIHDFFDYVPKYSRKQAAENGRKGGRAKAANQTAKQTASKPLGEPPTEPASETLANDQQTCSTRAPARRNPVPVPKEHLGDEIADEVRADVDELCTLLADLIEANGSKRPTVGSKWHTQARLMLDRDGRDLEQAKLLIRWSQAHPFWRSNILSMDKFRAQYDQLRLRADEAGGLRHLQPVADIPDEDIDPDEILGHDAWKPGSPPDTVDMDDVQAYRAWLKDAWAEHHRERVVQARAYLARRQA